MTEVVWRRHYKPERIKKGNVRIVRHSKNHAVGLPAQRTRADKQAMLEEPN